MTLSDVETHLCDRIAARQDDLLSQLAGYVAIPTGHGHTPGLDEFRGLLAARLETMGAAMTLVDGEPRPVWLDLPGATGSKTIPPTLVAHRPGAAGLPRILIVGHLDTVHDPDGDFRELTPSSDGRTVVGPGAVDMKGGIVVAINALEILAEAADRTGLDLGWTFVLNSDEETGSFHSDAALTAVAERHDIGIVLEPALPGGELALERGGAGQFKIELFGRSAHAGREFAKGLSAVVALAEVIVRLAALSDPDTGTVVNVGPLQGGLVTNTVPDYAACWGNVRFRDDTRAQQLGAAIDAMATDGDDTTARVVVHRQWSRPAKPATPAVRWLAGTAQTVAGDLGGTLGLSSTGGVCDGNILQAAGLPTLDTLGVCGGNLHRTDEFVEVESLVGRCRLLTVLLHRLAAGAATLAPR
ncbi:MAG: M20 family peptidase [Planctomycetota bacterium]|nr:MAG: M20 family peptidase [Planctomycetota bacterium]